MKKPYSQWTAIGLKRRYNKLVKDLNDGCNDPITVFYGCYDVIHSCYDRKIKEVENELMKREQ